MIKKQWRIMEFDTSMNDIKFSAYLREREDNIYNQLLVASLELNDEHKIYNMVELSEKDYDKLIEYLVEKHHDTTLRGSTWLCLNLPYQALYVQKVPGAEDNTFLFYNVPESGLYEM